jgi:hypothetical protein
MQVQLPEINIDYTTEHVPTVEDFMMWDKRIRGVVGPFGSGKSSGMLWEMIRRGHMQRPGSDGIRRTRWAVVRNTYVQLSDTTIKTVLDWLPPMVFGNYRSAAHEYIITGFMGVEIELLFRALDKPEQISNLLSLELTGAWVNEAREVPKAIIDGIDGRINRFPSNREGGRTWTGIIMDTNPPDEDSWWYDLFEEIKPENTQLFKQPSGLSPEAENICAPGKTPDDYPKGRQPGLTNDYYVELAKGKSQAYIDVYIKGLYGYVKEGKPVYESSWNDTLHVAADPLRLVHGRELIIGIDFGLTPCAIIGQITPRGFINILEEVLSEGMGIERFCRDMLKPLLATKYEDYKVIVIGDPAGVAGAQTDEKTCFEVLKEQGFEARPARSNNLVDRTGSVENFLSRLTDGNPTFQLDSSCKVLRKGFNKGYCFRKIQGSGERYALEPMKNHWSHPHDALQYLCLHILAQIAKSRKKKKRYKPKYQPASKGGY